MCFTLDDGLDAVDGGRMTGGREPRALGTEQALEPAERVVEHGGQMRRGPSGFAGGEGRGRVEHLDVVPVPSAVDRPWSGRQMPAPMTQTCVLREQFARPTVSFAPGAAQRLAPARRTWFLPACVRHVAPPRPTLDGGRVSVIPETRACVCQFYVFAEITYMPRAVCALRTSWTNSLR